MVQLANALNSWGAPDFERVVKEEIEKLTVSELPLQQGLSASSYAVDTPFEAMIIGVSDGDGTIRVKAGIFFSGIVAGCSCADDPTPVEEQREYCVMQFDIDRASGETVATLVDE